MAENNPTIAAETEHVLHATFVRARDKRHAIVTVEHLLLSLLYDDTLKDMWVDLQIDKQRLSRNLTKFLGDNSPVVSESEEVDTQHTLGFERVIQRAIMRRQQNSHSKSVLPIDLLLAIFDEKDSHAVFYLQKSNVTRESLEAYVSGKEVPTPSSSGGVESENALARKIQQASDAFQTGSAGGSPEGKVFISYSHADTVCLERLLVHLTPLAKAKAINCWSDQQIRVGDKWRNEIQKNLDEAAIAILLISADFLASDFIVNNELPPLLMAADTKGIRILPVILKPCGFLRDPVLSTFQAVNDPKAPLMGMHHIQQEEIYDRIAGDVAAEMLRLAKGAH